jgi:hypothetical protein
MSFVVTRLELEDILSSEIVITRLGRAGARQTRSAKPQEKGMLDNGYQSIVT